MVYYLTLPIEINHCYLGFIQQRNLLRAREEKFQSKLKVLETLATGTTEENEVFRRTSKCPDLCFRFRNQNGVFNPGYKLVSFYVQVVMNQLQRMKVEYSSHFLPPDQLIKHICYQDQAI